MAYATGVVLQYFPMLKDHIPNGDSALLTDDSLSKLNPTQQTFLRLIWFFEKPNEANFNLESLYKELDEDWIEFALEAVYTFFKKDTYLLQQSQSMLVKEDSEFLNQSQFARYLSDQGLNYSRKKFNVYLSRGKLPKPDLTVSGTPYWELITCESFVKELEK